MMKNPWFSSDGRVALDLGEVIYAEWDEDVDGRFLAVRLRGTATEDAEIQLCEDDGRDVMAALRDLASP